MTTPFLAVCDPPWLSDSGGGNRGANAHYDLPDGVGVSYAMQTAECWQPDGPGLLWMWATSRALVTGDAFLLASRLGFRPCASWVWAKVDVVGTHLGHEAYQPSRKPGLGQWQRCEHEHLILCRRGDVSVPDPRARARSMIYAPRGRHSEKPAAAWAVIEAVSRSSLGADVRGVEFFARTQRPGWGAWGTLNGPHTAAVFRPAAQP